MSYKLEKPVSIQQRADFIVQYNHNKGLRIEETDNALYALEAWELLQGDTVIDNKEAYEQEQAQKEAERIGNLFLTGADVERGIYQAKGIDFEDIIQMVETLIFAEAPQVQGIDLKALRIELKANHFYRGNPYVNAVGALLGFTSEQLDKFFETNDYTTLLPQSDKVEGESDKVSDIVTEQVEDTSEQVEVVNES